MSLPSTNTVPEAGFSKPDMMLSNVVFPDPLTPCSRVITPGCMETVTSSRTRLRLCVVEKL